MSKKNTHALMPQVRAGIPKYDYAAKNDIAVAKVEWLLESALAGRPLPLASFLPPVDVSNPPAILAPRVCRLDALDAAAGAAAAVAGPSDAEATTRAAGEPHERHYDYNLVILFYALIDLQWVAYAGGQIVFGSRTWAPRHASMWPASWELI